MGEKAVTHRELQVVPEPPEWAALGDLIILVSPDGDEQYYYWRGYDGSLAMAGPFQDAVAAWRASRVWLGQQLALKG